jgi:hypothetical protein
MAAAQTERETALRKAEEALKQAADVQRKRARVRNIGLVVVSIMVVLAGLLAWLLKRQHHICVGMNVRLDLPTSICRVNQNTVR